MPFVCPKSTFTVTDLSPHKTQDSAVYSPLFQGPITLKAHARAVNEDVALDANFDTAVAYSGVSAYVLATTDNAGDALTANQANAIGGAIVDALDSGTELTQAVLDGIVVANTQAGNTFDGDLVELLQIVSGYKVFTLPAQSIGDENNGGAFEGPFVLNNFFADPTDGFLDTTITSFGNSFYLSARRGQLKTAQTAVNPLVVCYADDGTLIQ